MDIVSNSYNKPLLSIIPASEDDLAYSQVIYYKMRFDWDLKDPAHAKTKIAYALETEALLCGGTSSNIACYQ